MNESIVRCKDTIQCNANTVVHSVKIRRGTKTDTDRWIREQNIWQLIPRLTQGTQTTSRQTSLYRTQLSEFNSRKEILI